jgi:hypothetical protein
LIRRRSTALLTLAAAGALLIPATPAGAGDPTARTSGEELVSFITTGKLKVKSPLKYQLVCGAPSPANCAITVEAEIVLKGPNLTVSNSGVLVSGQIGIHEISINKGVRNAIKDNLKSSKLRATVDATNTLTGEVDSDTSTFKFKR